MIPPHSPEIDLMRLACSLTMTPNRAARLTELMNHSPDWERLYALANRHRVIPFLYRNLRQLPATPPDFLARLHLECRAIATDNLLKMNHYQHVDRLLTGAGISFRAMKGVLWATTRYPNANLRPIGDLDLLIDPANVPAALAVLRANGFGVSATHQLYLAHGIETMLGDLWEISLYKPFGNGGRYDVDLHWGVECFNRDYKLFSLADLTAHPGLELEQQVLLLTVHHGVNNVWQHLSYLNDLFFLLHESTLNWSWLTQQLRQYGLENVFLAGLHLCGQQWPLALPPALNTAQNSPYIRQLAQGYVANWEASHSREHGQLILDKLQFLLKAQPGVGQRWVIWRTALTSRLQRISLFRVGHRLVYVPRTFGFLTIFARAIRSVWRFAALPR